MLEERVAQAVADPGGKVTDPDDEQQREYLISYLILSSSSISSSPPQMARYASPTIYHISKQRWAMGAAPLRPALIADV